MTIGLGSGVDEDVSPGYLCGFKWDYFPCYSVSGDVVAYYGVGRGGSGPRV